MGGLIGRKLKRIGNTATIRAEFVDVSSQNMRRRQSTDPTLRFLGIPLTPNRGGRTDFSAAHCSTESRASQLGRQIEVTDVLESNKKIAFCPAGRIPWSKFRSASAFLN